MMIWASMMTFARTASLPRRPWAIGLCLILLSCRTPAPTTPNLVDLPPECPEPPPAMSGIEELEELARSTREARANLMTRLEGVPQVLFATLHPIELSLMEAILDGPAKARQMDPPWLRDHLLRTSVVVHAQSPLTTLDGDARQAILLDSQGQKYPALYMTVQSDSKGWLYHFYFDPRASLVQESLSRVTFQLQLGRSRGEARWALSQRNMEALEGLPIQHLIVPLQKMRWVRWDLLVGDRNRATEEIAEIAHCSPNLSQATVLKHVAARVPRASAATRQLSLSTPKSSGDPKLGNNMAPHEEDNSDPQRNRELLGHQPARDLVLRAELLNRLIPLGQTGLLPAQDMRHAQELLQQGVQHLAKETLQWGLPAVLLEIDQIIAKLLADALDVNAPLHPEAPDLGLLLIFGGPHLSAEVIAQELSQRIVLANMNLVPQWIKRPTCQDQHCRSGMILLEMRPLLVAKIEAGEIWAKAPLRMGWGWIHPGLPPHTYTVTFTDHSNDYWRAQADQVKGLAALKVLARRLLEQEIVGSNDASAALAMAGLVQLNQTSARARLTPLLKEGTPARRAATLQALSQLQGQEISGAIHAGLSSPHPVLRATALGALQCHQLASVRGNIWAGTKDHDPQVKAAALTTLLRCQDPQGNIIAREWLAGAAMNRAMVLQIVREKNIQPRGLAPGLLSQLTQAQPSEEVLQALQTVVKEMGDRAVRPLTTLYNTNQLLKHLIINSAQGPGFLGLLSQAAKEPDPNLRRTAILKISSTKHPPLALLEKAAEDPDLDVQLAGHLALAKQGRAKSLLALGAGARGTCTQRAMVLPTLCQSMDSGSRKQLLSDAMNSDCEELFPLVWKLILQFHPEDVELLKAFIKGPNRLYRVQGALAALGLREGAALGQIP